MAQPDLHNLKYGIIYLYSDRSLIAGLHNPEVIVEKFVAPLQVEWVDDPGRDDLLLVARRFNVGNIGRYATVSLSLSRMNRSGGWFEAIHHFADELMGVTDAGDGDIVLNESDYGYLYGGETSACDTLPQAAPQDKTVVKPSKPSRWKKFRESLSEMMTVENRQIVVSEEVAPNPRMRKMERARHDQLQEEEDRAVRQLERGRKEALERIRREIINYIARYHDDPKDLMEQLLRGKVVVGHPGRVLVNGDMKIVLPEYDEMEIEMPAMCRTLYILFMKQRKQGSEGIILKNMDRHSDEIKNIYYLVKPGANDQRVAQTVDNLCDPLSDSLNQMISRINRCIRNVFTDKELAKEYTISGKKGKAYSIGLDPEFMELPRAVTDD